MTTSRNYLPVETTRLWYGEGDLEELGGPVAGVSSWQTKQAASVYGPTYWFHDTSHGVAAEIAAYTGSWTWEGYIYLTNMGVNNHLFSAGAWARDDAVVCQIEVVSSKLRTFWENGTAADYYPSVSGGTSISVNTWTHLAVVKNATAKTVTYYFNGVQDGIATFDANPTCSDPPNRLRAGFGNYVGSTWLSEQNHVAQTFSTVQRSAGWIAASATQAAATGTLPTDSSTWVDMNTASDGRAGYERGAASVEMMVSSEIISGPTYRNRGYDTTLTRTVYWTSSTPGGGYSGPGPLTNTVVVEILC